MRRLLQVARASALATLLAGALAIASAALSRPAAPLPRASTAAPAAWPAVDDDMAERVRPCTACHGREGRAASDGYYPRIAGKPAGYLEAQLRHFRDGRRPYAPMRELLQPLSDAYLREIAAHFAALELPYPPPQAPTAAAAVLARGRALALQGDPARRLPPCAACHGRALTGVQPAIPGVLGLPRDYLNAQFGAWREGNRRATAPDCMGEIARRMSPDDVAAAAQWLAAQPVPVPARSAAAPHGPLPLACSALPGAERGAAPAR